MTTHFYTERQEWIPSVNDNILYRIGKCAKGNDTIIDMAEPNDIWFHLGGGLSSAHVIACVHTQPKMTKKQQRDIIKRCSLLLKMQSSTQCKSLTEVVYTKIQNVHKTDTLGQVHLDNCKTLTL